MLPTKVTKANNLDTTTIYSTIAVAMLLRMSANRERLESQYRSTHLDKVLTRLLQWFHLTSTNSNPCSVPGKLLRQSQASSTRATRDKYNLILQAYRSSSLPQRSQSQREAHISSNQAETTDPSALHISS